MSQPANTSETSDVTVVLNNIFSLLVHHLNKLYDNIENENTFPKLLLDYLEITLSIKQFRKIRHDFGQLRGNGISNKEIVSRFRRFYDNYYSFQLRCFYDENPTDNYETIKQFTYSYIKGYFGRPSYLNTKMFGSTSRNERLIELIARMEEEDRYYR
jgi:hypothetical protein